MKLGATVLATIGLALMLHGNPGGFIFLVLGALFFFTS